MDIGYWYRFYSQDPFLYRLSIMRAKKAIAGPWEGGRSDEIWRTNSESALPLGSPQLAFRIGLFLGIPGRGNPFLLTWRHQVNFLSPMYKEFKRGFFNLVLIYMANSQSKHWNKPCESKIISPLGEIRHSCGYFFSTSSFRLLFSTLQLLLLVLCFLTLLTLLYKTQPIMSKLKFMC